MWTEHLKQSPLRALLGSDDPALLFMVERDLLDQRPGTIENLWELDEPRKIISKQRSDGAWIYRGKRPGDEFGENYELLETWKILRVLVEIYGFNRKHASIKRAADFIFSCQQPEGDIRGILSNQYMPYYMGAIMEILIKAGYAEDERIQKGFKWLLNMRQEDGGWIVPLQIYPMRDYYQLCQKPAILPQKDLPFSHMASGMVIRAFACHDTYSQHPAAIRAGELLKSRFFLKDSYTSRQAISYWFKLQFPFWWTTVLTAMDALIRLGFPLEDEDIQKGIDWFIQSQDASGIWRSNYGGVQYQDINLWTTLAICRILKHYLA
jgi:hypothetical protein